MTKKPLIAICYDVDKTLSPMGGMQENNFFKKIHTTAEEFYKIVDKEVEDNNMERSLAYMLCMLKEAKKFNIIPTRDLIIEDGKKAKFYNGVETWFKRINDFAKKVGANVEHYVISANFKEVLQAMPISHEFKKIYASSFLYNEDNVATWPAQVVNYTYKTQFLYRIKKGILNEHDASINNRSSKKRIPFDNMIYIGDSFTDIPCMAITAENGGYAIGVYDDPNKINKVKQLVKDKRIQYFAFADYSENSQIEQIVKNIILKIKANSNLIEVAKNKN